VIKTAVTLPVSFQSAEVDISGVIGYQACDDSMCMMPAEMNFKKTFKVVPLSEDMIPSKTVSQPELKKTAGQASVSQTPEEGEFAKSVGDKGLFFTFLLIFLGGLALNLTPCVYPIIPITIGYFGGQAEGRKGKLIGHAFLYVLGMAVTYSALGVIAALTGSLFGSALQNPMVLIGIALVLVWLALSMFDLYEFRLPFFLTKMVGGSKKGFLGSLFMGLTVGLVAAPCIGPFILGLLTYVGEKGDVFLGFLMFFVLALGLGLPFLFLAVFSGSINKLPKSGSWMVWVRKIFGFILIAMAIYFLKPLFPNPLVYHLSLAVTLFLGGIYLAWIEPTEMKNKVFPFVRNIMGIVFFMVALFFVVRGIEAYVEASLNEARLESGSAVQGEMIRWSSYADAKIQKAEEDAKPVFLDFYADWCIPCKELDNLTYKDPKIVDISRKFIMLKVDLTTTNQPLFEKLRNKFKIKGVPTLVLLNAAGNEVREARVVGFIKAAGLLNKMKKVIELNN
jgi:thiol:disulfide interchange protein DsbD